MLKMVSMAITTLTVMTIGTDATAQTPVSAISYATPNRGGTVIETTGGLDAPAVGYARVQPAVSTTPSGFVMLELRQGGVLVNQTGLPGTPTMLSGRTYAEVNGSINTGVAFVNPGSLPVTIAFNFTDQFGNDFGQGSLALGTGAHTAKFFSEAPFSVRSAFAGTFTFSAPAAVGVIALRTLVNERGEFLVSNQTVTPIPDNIAAAPLTLAHFADGGGWKTGLVLVNTTDGAISGTVQFYGEGSATAEAAPVTLIVDGQRGSSFNYTIRARSSANLETSAPSGATRTGSVRITPGGGTATPAAFAALSFSRNRVTVSQATIQAQPPANTFRSYVEMNSSVPLSGAIQSAISITNNSATAATVTFELTSLDGSNSGLTAAVTVPAFGHVGRFVHDLFPVVDPPAGEVLRVPFRGILRVVSSNSIAFASFRMRYNERGDFLITTTPATNEASPSSSAELVFPHIVDRAGYSTQFVVFSGISGQATTGTLRFFGQDGQALNLTLR
jgi:hypothetical protein